MSGDDDLEGVARPPITDDVAEALFHGTASAIDGRPDLGPIAEVFRAARASGEADELASLDATVAAFSGALGARILQTTAQSTTAEASPMFKKYLTAKAAAVVGAITLVTAGAAAAATGSMPNPFSSGAAVESADTSGPTTDVVDDTIVVETTEDTVDDTMPDDSVVDDTTPDDSVVDGTEPDTTTPGDEGDEPDDTEDAALGPDANGPAKFGLCTAYSARTKHDDETETTEPDQTGDDDMVDNDTDETVPGTTIAGDEEEGDLPIPFRNLVDAATAAGQTVEEFCSDATPGGKSDDETKDNPSVTAPGRTKDNPSVTAPGKSGDNPSVTAPGKSGDNPSNTAPGKSGDNPSNTAPGKSEDNPSNTAPGKGGGSSSTGSSGNSPSVSAPGRSGQHGGG